jgi:hypothetical protein
VRRHLAEHQGGVRQGMAAILQGCVHDDDDKSGTSEQPQCIHQRKICIGVRANCDGWF